MFTINLEDGREAPSKASIYIYTTYSIYTDIQHIIYTYTLFKLLKLLAFMIILLANFKNDC